MINYKFTAEEKLKYEWQKPSPVQSRPVKWSALYLLCVQDQRFMWNKLIISVNKGRITIVGGMNILISDYFNFIYNWFPEFIKSWGNQKPLKFRIIIFSPADGFLMDSRVLMCICSSMFCLNWVKWASEVGKWNEVH